MKIAYRLVFAALVLNFWIPVLVYTFDPDSAIAQFVALGELLGAAPYPYAEQSMFWRVLGTANVATLGFLCLLVGLDAQRWKGAILPVAYLKSMAVLGWTMAFFAEGLPQYAVAAIFDLITVGLMVGFGHAGARALAAERAA